MEIIAWTMPADAVAKKSLRRGVGVDARLQRAVQSYPWMAAARRHAALIALLRWGTQPANVTFVDFAELATINAHRVITPDYVCRDEQQGCSVP
jgi:hypothetical protein